MQNLAKVKQAGEPAMLDLPRECRLVGWDGRAAAFRGVALHVFDPDRYQRGDGIQLQASSNKGEVAETVVEGGYAFIPLAKDQRITAISLHVPGAPNDADTRLPLALDQPSSVRGNR